MKPLSIILLFASLFCLQAMIVKQATDDSVLYTINDKRYQQIIFQMKQPSSTDQKLTLLMTYVTAFGFDCNKVWALVNLFINDDTRIQGLQVLMNNIIDPQNKQTQIINQFSSTSSRQQATTLLANITACKTAGIAPDVFPYPILNYTSAWNDTAFNGLIAQINAASFSSQKLAIAQNALLNTSNGITANQTVLLFSVFSFSNDMVALAQAIQNKTMGLYVDEVQRVLAKFSFSSDKLKVLAAFKYSVIDVENKYNILDSFSFSSDKDEARRILDDLRPKSFLFDVPTGNCVFVLDYSGSMDAKFTLSTGEKVSRLQFVQREFEKAALAFDSNTTFNIIIFSNGNLLWRPQLSNSSRANVLDGIAFTKKYIASGGTNIYDSLASAFKIPKVQTIYLLTDGTPTAGAVTNPDLIVQYVKNWYKQNPITINTIAFLMGSDPSDNKPVSKAFMKNLADATNGTYRALESDK